MLIEHPLHLMHTQEPQPEVPYAKRWVALTFICMIILISALDMTTLNTALSALTRQLGATTAQLQWIVASYAIMLAGLLLLGNGMADRYGRKGALLVGVFIFASASTAAAFASSASFLIGMRALMGVGAALFMPPALSMIAVLFAPAERARAIAIWAGIGGVGIAIGPSVAGFLVDRFGWGSVFLINLPVAAVGLIGIGLFVPKSRKPETGPPDFLGALLSIAGLGILLFGLIEGPEIGWDSPLALGTIGLGLLVITLYLQHELRADEPMFNPRVLKVGPVYAGGTVMFVIYVTLLGFLFLIPQYLQFVIGQTAFVAGLYLLPFGAAFILFTQIGPRLTAKMPPVQTLALGLGGMALAFAILTFLQGHGDSWLVLVGEMLYGASVGAIIAQATTGIMNALPLEQAGDGSAVNQLGRQIGGAVGVAVLGSIFATVFAGNLRPLAGLAPYPQAAKHSVGAAETYAKTLPGFEGAGAIQLIHTAFVTGMRWALIAATLFALAAIVVVLRGMRHPAPTGVPAAARVDSSDIPAPEGA
jgi:EmrB/QacA subfamily drug resistance transporter